MSGPVTVTQEDREAAASGYYAWISPNPRVPEKMVDGNADEHPIVFDRIKARYDDWLEKADA